MKHTVLATLFAIAIAVPALAEDAVCYNCPPQWADWTLMLESIDENLDIQMQHDNKNSGQTLSQLLAERASPVADVLIDPNGQLSAKVETVTFLVTHYWIALSGAVDTTFFSLHRGLSALRIGETVHLSVASDAIITLPQDKAI